MFYHFGIILNFYIPLLTVCSGRIDFRVFLRGSLTWLEYSPVKFGFWEFQILNYEFSNFQISNKKCVLENSSYLVIDMTNFEFSVTP